MEERDSVPVVFVKAFMHHENALIGCYNICSAPLEHGYVCAVLVKVLGNIMATISAAHNYHLLSFNIVLRRVIMLASMVNCRLELVLSVESGDLRFPRVAGAPDDMARTECSIRSVATG